VGGGTSPAHGTKDKAWYLIFCSFSTLRFQQDPSNKNKQQCPRQYAQTRHKVRSSYTSQAFIVGLVLGGEICWISKCQNKRQ